jgi:tetratricopeptide (TPR) repeat protein
MGRYDEALKEFKASVELEPYFAIGLFNIGLVFEKMGDFQQAARYYRKALQADPDFIKASEAIERISGF